MSLTSRTHHEHDLAGSAAGHDCFFCGGRLFDPALYWLGATGSLRLHAECVVPLFAHLARDVFACREQLMRDGHDAALNVLSDTLSARARDEN